MKEFPVKVVGSLETPDEYNDFTTELTNSLEDTGQILQQTKTHQLSASMANYSSVGEFYSCGGISTAYTLTPVSPRQGITELFNGSKVRFKPNTNNTGACTLNVNGWGAQPLVDFDGNALGADSLDTNHEYEATYDSSLPAWKLTHSTTITRIIPEQIDPNMILDNFTVSNPDYEVKFKAGMCAGGTASKRNLEYIVLTADMTKDIRVAWAAGDGNGGLAPTVSFSAGDTAHAFIIKKNDGTVDAGYDDNLNATNLLTVASGAYKYFRRIGSFIIKSDTPTVIHNFIQTENYFLYITPVLDVNALVIPDTNVVTHNLSVPIHFKAMVITNILADNNSAGASAHIYFHSPDVGDLSGDAGLNPLATIQSDDDKAGNAKVYTLTNTSGQIQSRQDLAGGRKISISTLGWIDFRKN